MVLGVIVLLFGASKLPDLARSAGSALGEFKAARYQAEKEFQQVKREALEDEPEEASGEKAEEKGVEEEKELEEE